MRGPATQDIHATVSGPADLFSDGGPAPEIPRYKTARRRNGFNRGCSEFQPGLPGLLPASIQQQGLHKYMGFTERGSRKDWDRIWTTVLVHTLADMWLTVAGLFHPNFEYIRQPIQEWLPCNHDVAILVPK